MPQMAPMSWLILFLFFSIMLIMFSTMNYYHYTPMIKKSEKTSFKKLTMNWKW
uniref:ATP synthase complex subunit 8 n=1 Tax=Platycnemis foliacea TaxID=1041950 RepID=A0A0F7J4L1_9ODON|nr:ATP synthase F0 subunit 8 [Platycnemis foliacea]AKH04371.1 ATP synthase F0 subunit 8 [Platycnemis foliacea]